MRVYVAVELSLPQNSVRNLRERHRGWAQPLFSGFSRLAVTRRVGLARLPRGAGEGAALTAWQEGSE